MSASEAYGWANMSRLNMRRFSSSPAAADSTMSISLMPGNGTMMPPSAVDQQISPQQRARAERPVLDALDGQRDQQRR